MLIRRYTGKDAQEAMLKVKVDLGSEAVILNTRKVRKRGFAGLFAKPLTEVLAAVDEEYDSKKSVNSDAQKKSKPQRGLYNTQGLLNTAQEEDNRIEHLEDRVKRMESVLNNIYSSITKDKKPAEENKRVETSPASEQLNGAGNSTENEVHRKEKTENNALVRFKNLLLENDIEPSVINKLTEKIIHFTDNTNNFEEICDIAEKMLIKIIGQPQTINLREDGKPTVVLFAGPTGVGKTTTLAKIAANYSLNHNKKIGFITADTYRIAAVEQLKTYAEILNIPVSVIYTPQEITEAISQHSDKDLILIDTAGRSHKNAAQFSELKMLVGQAAADEIYLVLNCSMSRLALREILNQYKFLKDYKLLFTKLDEVLVPGVILNARCATTKPLSYTTAGQSVPDDIEVANVPEIVKSMLQIKESNG